MWTAGQVRAARSGTGDGGGSLLCLQEAQRAHLSFLQPDGVGLGVGGRGSREEAVLHGLTGPRGVRERVALSPRTRP